MDTWRKFTKTETRFQKVVEVYNNTVLSPLDKMTLLKENLGWYICWRGKRMWLGERLELCANLADIRRRLET
jgi:hypothetical protein